LSEIQWSRTRFTLTAIITILYLGVAALLLRFANLGTLGGIALLVITAIAATRLALTPWAAGISGEGLHLRSLLRGHQLLSWDQLLEVKAAPGIIQVRTRAGRALRIPDPGGSLAQGLQQHYREKGVRA
jgi:hypothetical protein